MAHGHRLLSAARLEPVDQLRGQGQYDDPLLNIDGKEEKVAGYVTDIFTKNAVDFIRAEHSKPFVLYVAHKAVHGPFIPAARHKDVFANETIHRPASAQDTLEGKPMLQRAVGKLPPLIPDRFPVDAGRFHRNLLHFRGIEPELQL